MRDIAIIRNRHPEEAAAFFAAKRVAECLRRRGENAFLKTISFSETFMAGFITHQKETRNRRFREKDFDFETEKYVSDLNNPLIFEFHNYNPLDPGEVSYFRPRDPMLDPVYPVFYSKMIEARAAGTEGKNNQNPLKRAEVFYCVDMSGKIIFLELPAIWKMQHNHSFKNYRSGQVVDFQATKERGLVSDGIVQGLADLIIEIRKKIEAGEEIGDPMQGFYDNVTD
ncbi:MAG: hypothetical protein QW112_01875 [Candidatus Micrarchaeia archaeon]